MSKGPDSAPNSTTASPGGVRCVIPTLLSHEDSQATVDVQAERASGRICEKCEGSGWVDSKKINACPKCLGYGMYKPKA